MRAKLAINSQIRNPFPEKLTLLIRFNVNKKRLNHRSYPFTNQKLSFCASKEHLSPFKRITFTKQNAPPPKKESSKEMEDFLSSASEKRTEEINLPSLKGTLYEQGVFHLQNSLHQVHSRLFPDHRYRFPGSTHRCHPHDQLLPR